MCPLGKRCMDSIVGATRCFFAFECRLSCVNAKLEIWEDMFHGWHSNAHILKDAEDAIISIGKFCRNLLNQ